MRNLFIFVVVLLAAACTRTHDEVVVNMDAPQTTKISKEQALKNLYSELKIIDGTTRSDGSSRSVKSIKELKGAVTRSGDALANDLLYIVEFEEGQGSAVVAADTRLDPVIAVLDSSVITEEDFSSTNTEDIGVYMASMISDYAASTTSSEGPFPFMPAPGDTGADTTFIYDIYPLLKTKWHQGSPFNDKCVEVYGENAVAGCAPVALAQFIYYTFPNTPMMINNTLFNTSSFKTLEYRVFPTQTANEMVAKFLYAIGVEVDASYGNGSTSVGTDDTVDFLKSKFSSMSSANNVSYNSSTVFSKLYMNKVVMMFGWTSTGGGHAWILDGGYHYIVNGTKFTHDGGSEEVTIVCKKVHCNYGWGGSCDGYYVEGVFDTTETNYDREFAIGDALTTNGEHNFAYNLQIVNY